MDRARNDGRLLFRIMSLALEITNQQPYAEQPDTCCFCGGLRAYKHHKEGCAYAALREAVSEFMRTENQPVGGNTPNA